MIMCSAKGRWIFISFLFSQGFLPSVSLATSKDEMKVVGMWSTFNNQINLRCVCYFDITQIEPVFFVNLTLTRSAVFHGAWIAKQIDSSSSNLWHLLENKYYSYPPTIALWFDIRYQHSNPKPNGECLWSLHDPTLQSTTANTTTTFTTTTTTDSSNVTTNTTTTPPVTITQPTTTQNTTATGSADTGEDNSSTVVQSTTPEVQHTSTSCLCPCECAKTSQEEVESMIKEITDDLAIDVNNTTLARRKLKSASDSRWLSRGLGWMGIVILTLVFGSIALADYRRFLVGIRLLIANLRGQQLNLQDFDTNDYHIRHNQRTWRKNASVR